MAQDKDDIKLEIYQDVENGNGFVFEEQNFKVTKHRTDVSHSHAL
jgi:hypothetical protein